MCAHEKQFINTNSLVETFSSLIPESIRFGIRIYDSTLGSDDLKRFRLNIPLSEHEQKDIQHVVAKREIEYRTGRQLARNLLGLNRQDTHISLHKKENGAPNWPIGSIGSISHSASVCIVAMTSNKEFAGIGIDIEYGNFEPDFQNYILDSNESLDYPGELSKLAALRTVFCCKEAIYKSMERYLTERIYFKDISVHFTKPARNGIVKFEALLNKNTAYKKIPHLMSIQGSVYSDENMAMSIALLCPF